MDNIAQMQQEKIDNISFFLWSNSDIDMEGSREVSVCISELWEELKGIVEDGR